MKLRQSAHFGALAAAALSLSLIGTGSASADTDAPSTSAVGSYSYTPPADTGVTVKRSTKVAASEIPPFDITGVFVQDGVLYQPGFNGIGTTMEYSFAGTDDQIDLIKPLIGISGKAKGRGLLFPADDWPTTDFDLGTKASYGVGKARLGNFEIHYSDGTVGVDTIKSNYFQIRVATDGVIKIVRTGSTVKFYVRIDKFHPTKGKWVGHSGAKAYIQYQSGETWKTLKTVTLDSTGRAKYGFKPNSAHLYRLHMPTSSTILGGTTGGIGPI